MRDRDTVELDQRLLDVPGGHAALVQGENLVFHAGQPGLALLDQLRLEAAVTITRRLDLQLAERALDRLGGLAVARIAAPAALGLVVLLVAQMGVHLGFQAAIDQALQHLRVQLVHVLRRLAAGQHFIENLRFQRHVTAPRRHHRQCLKGQLHGSIYRLAAAGGSVSRSAPCLAETDRGHLFLGIQAISRQP